MAFTLCAIILLVGLLSSTSVVSYDTSSPPRPRQQHPSRHWYGASRDWIDPTPLIEDDTMTTTTRKSFLRNMRSAAATTIILMIRPNWSQAAAPEVETIGKDPNCHDASCLGVWDGLLANCDHPQLSNPIISSATAGCVSSQDDTPGTFAEPWDYSDDSTLKTLTMSSNSDPDGSNENQSVPQIMDRVVHAIQTVANRRGDTVEIVWQQQRYLRVLFTDQSSGETSHGEFYITPHDTTIQFRLSSTDTNSTGNSSNRRRRFMVMNPSSFRNMDRAELIRRELKWLKLPILRNRQRALFFVESDYDTFGPQSAALGPPEEMKLHDWMVRGN